jgi:phosphoribosylformimino-5-aminoimidazole carboxamide ribotide isomerase
MIVPSIDVMNGQTVQLVGGREKALDAGDPRPLAEKFRLAGEIAVIDLDAALGQGSNKEQIEQVLKLAPCRVGGGIRDVETARGWLNAGAQKVILGTAARADILGELPRERVIAALDAEHDEIVVEGWRKKTGTRVIDRIRELRELVGGFLVTFVECEGRLGGIDLSRVKPLVEAAGDAKLTVAGGVTTAEEIAALDKLGVDAQVGMAIYTGRLHLADAIGAPLHSDRADGLWPTIVTDEHGVALGLAYSNAASLREAIDRRQGVYQSRSRGLWVKGETSGDTQELLGVALDCDRDTLRFMVRQHGKGFCHLGTWGCFGEAGGLPELTRRLIDRLAGAPAGSYTAKLMRDPKLLAQKLAEEAEELAQAEGREDVVWETADVIYFALVALARSGGTLAEVEAELARRALAVTRRSEKESKE